VTGDLGQLVEQCRIATERRIADIDPPNRAIPINDEGSVAEVVLLEHAVGVRRLVSRIGKDQKAKRAGLLKPFPRQLRRVGADGNHPRAKFMD
jgi:hypothetical protein